MTLTNIAKWKNEFRSLVKTRRTKQYNWQSGRLDVLDRVRTIYTTMFIYDKKYALTMPLNVGTRKWKKSNS